jgi:phosphate transport system permease protein
MIVGLLLVVAWSGARTFWPGPVVAVETVGGGLHMGEVTVTERFRPGAAALEALPEDARDAARASALAGGGWARRRMLRTGNYELTGEHFRWFADFEVAREKRPEWALVVEREAWGRFYGTPSAFVVDGEVAATRPGEVWDLFLSRHGPVRERREECRRLEIRDIGRVNRELERARVRERQAELDHGRGSPEWERAHAGHEEAERRAEAEFARIQAAIGALRAENDRYRIVLTTADGTGQPLAVEDVVRAYPANRLSRSEKAGVYLSRALEFLTAEPREANSEGGILPAIFGTVAMTLVMSVMVVPFGVLAALYLREYARPGPVVTLVRIAISNLAGVPSIVFGVFGLGFFGYIVGAGIDELFYEARLPNPTFGKGGLLWASLTLALLTLPVVIVPTEEALAAVPGSMREGSYACGATRWQTIRRIVLPRAMPGIMTGMILALARGAGEVAPLMLVGAVKLAPELPVDATWPFVHPSRSFMHLGFHIYDLGFQSQNSEAARPMVYATTLCLIGLVVVLNLAAIWIRARLRRRFQGSSP